MFDSSCSSRDDLELPRLIDALADLDQRVEDSVRVERIRMLEQLKSAVAAAQARETAALADEQSGTQPRRSVAGQVGLARRVSPFHAARYVGWARILTAELPETFAALQAGRVSEWRAMLVARETAWLSREHRAVVDAELAPQLEQLGDRRVEAEAKKLGYRLDPVGYLDRIRGAESDRHVGLRPAPEAMTRLTGLLPVAQGVAAHAALSREADRLIGAGDGRTRGQIMADTLVERLTGQTTASGVPLEIQLVMTDASLLDGGCEPAHLDGHGPLPAGHARRLVFDADPATPMWLRRLFIRPEAGQLAAQDSRRRRFTAAQRRFVRVRDQYCRTSWCEAPIRHADHITPAEFGGATIVQNAQGYCAACNYTKQARGWHTRVLSSEHEAHLIEITTPTGHRYRSRAPDPPANPLPDDPRGKMQEHVAAA
jgi:hypothetical protein